MAGRLVALLSAIALVACIHAIERHEQPGELLQLLFSEPDRHLGRGELMLYSLLFLLGLPAAALLAYALTDSLWTRLCALAGRAGLLAPAVLASAAALCVSCFVTHHAWFTDDEQAYLFQMQTYRRLALRVAALQPELPFHHPFVVVSGNQDGVPQWSGIYPILQPLMMALSSVVAHPLLSQWLCVGLIVYHAGRLAETLTGERRLGIGAAWLCATSPMLIGLGATYHSSILACLLSVLAVRGLLSARREGTFLRGGLVGLAAGALFLTRGLEGTLLIVVAGLVLALAMWARPREAWSALAGFALLCALCAGVYVGVNRAITGEWLRTPYAIWSAHVGRLMGFGEGDMMWERFHTPLHGLSQTFTTLVRLNTWLFAWPLSLVLPLLALWRPLRDSSALWLLGLSALQLGGYFFLPFGSVQDFGSAYHVWHLPWVAAVVVLVLKSSRALVPRAGKLLPAMTCVGLLTFWPPQLVKWHRVSEVVLAPVRAAEEAARGRRAVVVWEHMKAADAYSWVYAPPAPFPDSQILWMHDGPGAVRAARRSFPDRAVYRLVWNGSTPHVFEVPGPR